MKKLRIISLGLAAALFAAALPDPALAGMSMALASGIDSNEDADTDTDNTPTETIEISTVDDLVALSENCDVDNWSIRKAVVLTQDISLANTDFQMIPIFSGTFDGKGHTISGYSGVTDGYASGLFRFIGPEGTVKNLKLEGTIDASDEDTSIGGICGVNYGIIENCSFRGGISGHDTVGGIVGTNASFGFITDCAVEGYVSGYYMTGGIAGLNHGTITYSKNHSNINNSSAWVEGDDEMGGLLNIDGSDDEALYSGVDTGGIAGYSDGTLTRCTNYGKVGYEHTGYNIGGIVGRHAGLLSLCQNEGEVYGRKDIGGIVGQMEPEIEVTEAESLRNAVNTLHDLIGATLDDLKAGKDALKPDFDNLAAYGEGVVDSGHALADQVTDFINDNMDQLNAISSRMEYVTDQLPAVINDATAAGNYLQGFTDALHQAIADIQSHAQQFTLPEETGGSVGENATESASPTDNAPTEGNPATTGDQADISPSASREAATRTFSLMPLTDTDDSSTDSPDNEALPDSSLPDDSSSSDDGSLSSPEQSLPTDEPQDQDTSSPESDLSNSQPMDESSLSDLPLPDNEALPDDGVLPDLQLPDITEENLDDLMAFLQEAANRANETLEALRSIITNVDGAIQHWKDLSEEEQEAILSKVANLFNDLKDMASAVASLQSALNDLTTSEQLRNELDLAYQYLQSMSASITNAMSGLSSIINYLSVQPDLHFAELGTEFDASKDGLNTQLKGITSTLESLSQNASDYSDLVVADLSAVNDQVNVVFQLLADKLTGYDSLNPESLYEEASDEAIDAVTSGRTDACTNTGAINGDINIGGIAGSMEIDEEDPEDNAAGSIQYELGQRYLLKCVISECVNKGEVTAKKDGAGGIAGYMGHGVITDSEAYGSIESTEGGFVGGICGESLTIIQRCYALCDVSGSKNVGGIAGYATNLKNCDAIVSLDAPSGSVGAIAGQVADYNKTEENKYAGISGNYYVSDEFSGIDSISYVDVAEPLSYEEFLKLDGLPNSFRHLTVTYRIEDTVLGTQEVKFGDSLANLDFPEIPEKEGYYGVWPDYSEETMKGNLTIDGEYHDSVLIVESEEKGGTEWNSDIGRPYALAERTFTEDTVLTADVSETEPPASADGKDSVCYDVTLENGNISETDSFPIRLLNPYSGDAEAFSYQDGKWTAIDSKARGSYLQVDMTGTTGTYCIIEKRSHTVAIVAAVVGVAAVVLLLVLIKKLFQKRKVAKKP